MSKEILAAEAVFIDSIERAKRIGKLDFFDISSNRERPSFTAYANLPGLLRCGMLSTSTAIAHIYPFDINVRCLSFYTDFAGHLDISIDSRTYVAPPGKMVVSDPDQHESTHPATGFLCPGAYGWLCLAMGTDATGHWIWPEWVTLPQEFLLEIETMLRTLNVPLIDVSPAFQECCKFIRYTYMRRHDEDSFNARLAPFITLLIVEVHDILAGQPPLADDPPEARANLRQVERVTKMLSRRYMDKGLTIDMIAKESGLCRSRFTKLFTRLTGESPRHYILSLRLEEAKRLLAATDESVAVIAKKVGFLGTSRFFELFRTKIGMPPLDYRRVTRQTPK